MQNVNFNPHRIARPAGRRWVGSEPARVARIHAPVPQRQAGRPAAPQLAYSHIRQDIIDLIPSRAISVLDVGCSDGATGRELRRLNGDRRLVGLDVSESAARLARETYDRALVCDLDDPSGLQPLGAETFDAIIAPDVLEHLRDPARALSNLIGHLKPGGVVVVSLPNIQHVSGIFTIATGRFPREQAGLFDQTHLRWFTRREAESMFHACGLSVTAVRRNLKLSLRRRGRPLWPILRLAGDFFATQLVFQLRLAHAVGKP